MKIQIDTKAKSFTIEETIITRDLISTLEKLFPDGSWKEYTLTVTTITNWTYPIIYREWTQPYYPWQSPIIYGNGTGIEHTAEPYKITCDACDSTYNGPRYSENNIIGSRTIFNVEM